ncbi:dipeptide ABC transporter ATP-binding protein [Comamonas composti]|uniref:dipeptide ABC transporter ATP-binding protein n=1 Tax=Comamonas composti TaxID=408558 RepID=UPI000409DDCC|nr:ABC transporter ATP-binding protein [Comamonas composti]
MRLSIWSNGVRVQAADVILSVQDLSVELRAAGACRPLLSEVSFELERGAVLGVIGESGSGKTVLCRALVNWLRPPLHAVGGQVFYAGRNLLACSAREMADLRGREIAYIGANPASALDPTMPVGTQILEKLQSVIPGMSRDQALRRVIDLLDAVRIPSAAKRFHEYPFQFSGGMMQRALIVDALVSNPLLLIADNITQPLDVTVAAQILRLLKELQQAYSTAIVFVSSQLGVVSEIADRVLVLNQGRVVEQAPVARLLVSPAHAYTRALLDRVPRVWGIPAPARPLPGQPVLEVRAVTKTYVQRDRNAFFTYSKVHAVRGVSFCVRRGENLGIIGESGCGKSTLSRLLSSLEQPDAGSIHFDGHDLKGLERRALMRVRQRFQLLLQDPYGAIVSHASIGRTIAEPLLVHGLASGQPLRRRVTEAMAEVGLAPDLYDSLPVGLSAGQRQRVNIARALVLEPELLILDETLSALDQVEQAKLLDLFQGLQERRGITYVYISHDLAMVRRVCSRIAVMYLGRIVELSDNQALFEQGSHPYTRALLSAAPTLERRPYSRQTYLLEGEPPDPVNIAPGCSFRSRCPFAMAQCASQDPVLRSVAAESQVACHFDAAHMPVQRPQAMPMKNAAPLSHQTKE